MVDPVRVAVAFIELPEPDPTPEPSLFGRRSLRGPEELLVRAEQEAVRQGCSLSALLLGLVDARLSGRPTRDSIRSIEELGKQRPGVSKKNRRRAKTHQEPP